MLYIVLEIPNIPLQEGKKVISFITTNYSYQIKKSFIWQNGVGIFFENNKNIIKGPKIDEKDKVNFFKKKMIDINKDTVFYYEQDRIYAKQENNDNNIDLINIIKNIPWIKPMKIGSDYCCRPVKNIYISSYDINNKNNSYCYIEPQVNQFNMENIEEYFFEKKQTIINIEKKYIMLNINKENIDKNHINLYEEILHNTSIPHKISVNFDKKYSVLPSFLIEYILKKEQQIFTIYNEDKKIMNFEFILDHKKKEKPNLEIVINSRLEDLYISYERDKKIIKFNNKYINNETKNNNKLEDFELFTFFLKEEMNFQNLDNNKLRFLIHNYKSDYKTTIVEEYAELGGVLNAYFYKDLYEDFDIEIYNGFLSLNGNIKNDYGFLMYLSIKLFLLLSISKNKQLATSTKDPFGTRGLVDNILIICNKFNKKIPSIHKELDDFIEKRLSYL